MSFGISDISGALEHGHEFALSTSVEASGEVSQRSGFEFKRFFDINIALLVLVTLAPLLATVAVLLLISQGRPVFIRHRRIGRDGKTFPCFKFRTMVRDAEQVLQDVLAADPDVRAEWEASRKLRCDPRITTFGKVLRETSIDEIPQLFNVLRGHMSLVGPRPIVAEEIEVYGPKISHYYKVRPGLTGAWQVGGRSDVTFSQRVDMDAAYVQSRTFRTDLGILAKTVPAVLGRKGSR